MDDSKKRRISLETLEAVKSRINPELVNSLPVSIEEILPFVQRRTDPVISKNISPDLAQKMKDYRLSDEDYLITFLMAIMDTFYNKNRSDNPTASILLSQTGAGKTNLRTSILQKNSNTIIINSDQYKKFRPDADEILELDPTHFGALTGIDSYDHASNITEFAMAHSYDILIECAPSLQQGLIGVDCEKLREAGYNTEFHVMAVGDLISALAVHLRYEHELQLGKGKDTKLTDLKRHNESYLALEKFIKELEPKTVAVYRRGTEQEGKRPIKLESSEKSPYIILMDEREKSNKQYIESGKFDADYQYILETMKMRSAPQAQQQQLEKIYKMYVERVGLENVVVQSCIAPLKHNIGDRKLTDDLEQE